MIQKVSPKYLKPAFDFFKSKGWEPFAFQQESWQDYLSGKSGLLNAPTGSGKTYAVALGIILDFIQKNPDTWQSNTSNGLQLIWITPLRALAQDLQLALQDLCQTIRLPWNVALRHGDTDSKTRAALKKQPPEILITTPETLHVLLSQQDNSNLFKSLQCIVVDEWHELVGNKRGVQVQLALAYLEFRTPNQIRRWGISATLGNLEEAGKALLGQRTPLHIRKASIEKKIKIESIFPDEIESYPWSGHLGIRLLDQVIAVIEAGKTVLLFTNTRSQTEIWYQKILASRPDWAGWIAMHHGSLDSDVRTWVEQSLHEGKLKVVVCTSSLDLGVDFRPVDRVIQVGSPKGVARLIQRAGRSGHRPGEESRLYFVPTHALELIEAAALRKAIEAKEVESQIPPHLPYDVLIQFLVTLAVGEGFFKEELYQVALSTYSFSKLSLQEMEWILRFICIGGDSLGSYEDFQKVEEQENGLFLVKNPKIARKHRLSMGTIVSEPSIKIKLKNGSFLGTVEEYFISKLRIGDRFIFAGRALELLQFKELTAVVKITPKRPNQVVSWMGARMSLSSMLSAQLLHQLQEYKNGQITSEELRRMAPLLNLQQKLSLIPDPDTLLLETYESDQGYHLFFFPFEGRMVHELMAALLAYRIAQSYPVTFSMGMNDYGFELLSEDRIPILEVLEEDLFGMRNLQEDAFRCVNESEMSRRKFREIASISGLVFHGYPGKPVGFKHIQSNSSLIFRVLETYDSHNLLLKQAQKEALNQQMESKKFVSAFEKINQQTIQVRSPTQFTPFAFPILVDRMSRTSISSESLEDRIAKIQAHFNVWD